MKKNNTGNTITGTTITGTTITGTSISEGNRPSDSDEVTKADIKAIKIIKRYIKAGYSIEVKFTADGLWVIYVVNKRKIS